MKIVEIFKSIEGEGSRAGLPTTFIRLHGCNLNCSYCDSKYACNGDDYTELSIDDIIIKVKELGLHNITITGGEPLLHSEISKLIKKLIDELSCFINVETNGSIDISKFCSQSSEHLMFTLDCKCPTSNMAHKMNWNNYAQCRNIDVVKFVVGSKIDLDYMRFCMCDQLKNCKAQIYVSPVFGKIDPKQIVEYLLAYRLENIKVQLQLHKFIWPADMRGV